MVWSRSIWRPTQDQSRSKWSRSNRKADNQSITISTWSWISSKIPTVTLPRRRGTPTQWRGTTLSISIYRRRHGFLVKTKWSKLKPQIRSTDSNSRSCWTSTGIHRTFHQRKICYLMIALWIPHSHKSSKLLHRGNSWKLGITHDVRNVDR